ncbi:hypothetical protein [Photobacterium sanguinicancri]|uniref:hypothetical protein n=1 Tax=Photobacterium sanguinicancri TaxID=875932 RepID=UPI0021C4BD9E|nr:hypothetical protein [Photobacterium sanguinicancri]
MRPMTYARSNTRSPSLSRTTSHAPRFKARTAPQVSADIHQMPSQTITSTKSANEKAA